MAQCDYPLEEIDVEQERKVEFYAKYGVHWHEANWISNKKALELIELEQRNGGELDRETSPSQHLKNM
jgi:hypothetical protein